MTLPPTLGLSPAETASELLFRPLALLDAGRQAHGPRFTLDLGPRGRLVVTGAVDDFTALFAAPAEDLSAAVTTPGLLPFLGDQAVLALDGQDHRQTRRLLGGVLGAATPAVPDLVRAELATWDPDREVRLDQAMGRIALGFTTRWLIGRPAPALAAAAQEVLAHTSPSLQARDQPWPPLVRAREALRLGLRGAAPEPESLLDCLRQVGGDTAWTLDQAVALIIAGHETTAATLSWAASWLGEAAPDDPAAFCWEVLRLHPVVPFVLRTTRVITALGPWTLPADTTLALAVCLVHRDPAVFPDPLAFRPERFGGRRPTAPAWSPFGGGARQCLGLHGALQVLPQVVETLGGLVRFAPWEGPRPRPVRRNLTLGPAGGVRRRFRLRAGGAEPSEPGIS